MSYRKKFQIKGLKTKASFADSLRPVLSHHLKRITRRAEKYLNKPDEVHLHSLRISLRRFRYILEAYCALIKPARFKKIYALAVALQNLLGERRDLDVMQAKLKQIFNAGNTPLPASVITELQTARSAFDRQIAEALPQFTAEKRLHKLVSA